jgi:hypothetical protein
MRVVIDTNTVISGFLWGSYPRQIIDLVRTQEITVYTSSFLLQELSEVLSRPKFYQRKLVLLVLMRIILFLAIKIY